MFRQLLSIVLVAGRPSFNFRQLSEQLGDFSLTSVNLQCDLPLTFHLAGRPFVNFRQLPKQPEYLLSNSVNLLYGREMMHQLLPTFPAVSRPSVNCHQLSMWPECCHPLPSTFLAADTLSVNFRLLFVRPGNLLSTSVHFPCGQETFCPLLCTCIAAGTLSANLCLLFAWLGNLP